MSYGHLHTWMAGIAAVATLGVSAPVLAADAAAVKQCESLTSLSSGQMKITRTRPVCPYLKVAQWDGKGSADDHKSFACVTPPQE